MNDFVSYLFGGMGFVGLGLLGFIGLNLKLPEAARKHYAGILSANFGSSGDALRVADGYAATDMPFRQTVSNVAVLSICGLLACVAYYVFTIDPRFKVSLYEDAYQRRQFATQVLVNGLPIVFVTNLAAALIYAAARGTERREGRAARILLVDLVVRMVCFLAVMAATYWLLARFGGGFGGDTRKAMRALLPTLIGAGRLENLTATYLVAVLLGALPLFVAAGLEAIETQNRVRWLLRLLGIRHFVEAYPLGTVAVVVLMFIVLCMTGVAVLAEAYTT